MSRGDNTTDAPKPDLFLIGWMAETYQIGSLPICPYCKTEFDPIDWGDFDGFEEGQEIECNNCDKTFYISGITVEYHTQKSCELNGLECSYQPLKVKDRLVPFCPICGSCNIDGIDNLEGKDGS